MNSTELYIKASEAICEWGKTHVGGCVLTLDGGAVFCCKIPEGRRIYKNALIVTAYETQNGLTGARWNEIGSELHNLFCKESACHARQKR